MGIEIINLQMNINLSKFIIYNLALSKNVSNKYMYILRAILKNYKKELSISKL